MASATGGTSSCSATRSAPCARIAVSRSWVFVLRNSWLNVATRSRVPPSAAVSRLGTKRAPKSDRNTTSGSAVTRYIQRVRISSAAGTSSSNGRKKSAAKMFENAIDQCAPGANDPEPGEHDDANAIQNGTGGGQPARCSEMSRVKPGRPDRAAREVWRPARTTISQQRSQRRGRRIRAREDPRWPHRTHEGEPVKHLARTRAASAFGDRAPRRGQHPLHGTRRSFLPSRSTTCHR